MQFCSVTAAVSRPVWRCLVTGEVLRTILANPMHPCFLKNLRQILQRVVRSGVKQVCDSSRKAVSHTCVLSLYKILRWSRFIFFVPEVKYSLQICANWTEHSCGMNRATSFPQWFKNHLIVCFIASAQWPVNSVAFIEKFSFSKLILLCTESFKV